MQVMVEVVMEAVVDEEVDNIVGKCQILYTDQIAESSKQILTREKLVNRDIYSA